MMFGIAPVKVIYIAVNGDVSYLDDVEPEDGVLSPADLPKTKIESPGLNESTCPVGNWKDSATGFVMPENSGVVDLASAIASHKNSTRWWDEYN